MGHVWLRYTDSLHNELVDLCLHFLNFIWIMLLLEQIHDSLIGTLVPNIVSIPLQVVNVAL